MKIAFVSLMSGLPWGGSEELWHATAMHFLQEGHKVFVSVLDWGILHPKIKLLSDNGAEIRLRDRNMHPRKINRLLHLFLNRKNAVSKDYQSILDFNPDVVCINQAETFDFAWSFKKLYYLLLEHKIPYSLVCHSLMQQYSFIPPKQIYPEAVEVFSNAKHIFFVAKRQWHLTERRLISKLYNAFFTWNPLNLPIPNSPLPWPDVSVTHMAIVGAFIGYKGQDTALEVLSGEQWKQRNWKLNIYGSGEGEQYLKDLAHFYNLQDKVVFHGHVKDIKDIWLNNHVLLIPSSQEGLPISLVEAMACARTAIVTDVGGNTELITEKEGFIAASPSTRHFSETMENAWIHKDNWENLGNLCFNKVKSTVDFNPQIRLYEHLLNTN